MADLLESHDPELHIVADGAAFTRYAESQLIRIVSQALEARGRATVVLSGGSTPRPIYQGLRRFAGIELVDWALGDERLVKLGDNRSNQSMLQRTMFERLELSEQRLTVPDLRLADDQIGPEYAMAVEQLLARDDDGLFDLTLLGLGDDGHTASLFPGVELSEPGLVQAGFAPDEPRRRISLTLEVLNRSRMVMFVVVGDAKAQAVQQASLGAINPAVPGSCIRPVNDAGQAGRLIWLLDPGAARLLGG